VKSEKVQSESDSGSEPRLPASPSLITSQFQSYTTCGTERVGFIFY